MMTRTIATLSLVALCSAPVFTQQGPRDNPLSAARDLYASARYDEALAVLNGMRPAPSDELAERRSIEQYKSLCLLALGRGTEAEVAIAAVVTADPLFQPSEAEASPRVRSAFSEVRQRLLPEIASTRYGFAKAAFDRRDFLVAEHQFRDLVMLLEDPQMAGRLSDLRVLASGFLDLSTAAQAPPPPPAPDPKPESRPPDVPPQAPLSAPSPVARPVSPQQIFTLEDPGVTPPVVIRQDVPRVQASILSQTRPLGMLELLIDEQGRVVNMTLRSSVHPLYDPILMAAARDWRYQPAMYKGAPVKFRKLIKINIEKR